MMQYYCILVSTANSRIVYTEVIPRPHSRKESKQTVAALGRLTPLPEKCYFKSPVTGLLAHFAEL